MSPDFDPALRAIVGERPGDDFVWCDECLRWEYGDVHLVHSRPPRSWFARVWFALESLLGILCDWCRERGELAQARYLVTTGQGRSMGAPRQRH